MFLFCLFLLLLLFSSLIVKMSWNNIIPAKCYFRTPRDLYNPNRVRYFNTKPSKEEIRESRTQISVKFPWWRYADLGLDRTRKLIKAKKERITKMYKGVPTFFLLDDDGEEFVVWFDIEAAEWKVASDDEEECYINVDTAKLLLSVGSRDVSNKETCSDPEEWHGMPLNEDCCDCDHEDQEEDWGWDVCEEEEDNGIPKSYFEYDSDLIDEDPKE